MFYVITIMAAALFSYGFMEKKKENGVKTPLGIESMGRGTLEGPLPDFIPSPEFMKEVFDQEEFLLLRKRMEDLEGTLFKSLLSWQEEKKVLLENLEGLQHKTKDLEQKESHLRGGGSLPLKKEMPPHIRAVVNYEREGRSLEEIVVLTKMNKGEVLLLQNLSKHYEA